LIPGPGPTNKSLVKTFRRFLILEHNSQGFKTTWTSLKKPGTLFDVHTPKDLKRHPDIGGNRSPPTRWLNPPGVFLFYL